MSTKCFILIHMIYFNFAYFKYNALLNYKHDKYMFYVTFKQN